MYIPKDNLNENREEIKSFIEQNGFAVMVSQMENKLWATHLPLQLSTNEKGEDILVGHIAKANPQWKYFEDEPEVLTIFSGAHAYISSSWYQVPNVPTWNYLAVHIYGKLNLISDEKLYQSLEDLINQYEKNNKNPMTMQKIPKKTMDTDFKGVVGFEIVITEVHAKKKLSQNRDNTDYKNIINELTASSDCQANALAEEMKKNRPDWD
ncbi:MAG: FMN-binding negative transcriptional regulator [Cytophagales bacterium]|nr:MAG: FMN-binding negative transcriptional regulator [Cytophagales bacterium]